jgi:hypothetical protein
MNVFPLCIFNYRLIESLDYACLLDIVVHVVKSFILCILIILKRYRKRKKSKGGLEGSIPRPVGGWVCYSLVSELLVETPGRYGPGLLVRVSWSRSNSDREVENLRRNGIAESTQEIERQRPVVRGSKDRDHPLRIRERSPL